MGYEGHRAIRGNTCTLYLNSWKDELPLAEMGKRWVTEVGVVTIRSSMLGIFCSWALLGNPAGNS